MRTKTPRLEDPSAPGVNRRELLKFSLGFGGACLATRFLAGSQLLAAFPQTATDLDAQTVRYSSGDDQIEAFLAMPKSAAKSPAVLLIHDDHGLDEATKKSARRLASEGYVALAPDLFSTRAGTDKISPPERERAASLLSVQASMDHLQKATDFLRTKDRVDVKHLAVLGFGWGGARAFRFATTGADLQAVVVFSGATPAEGFAEIQSPVQAHYGEFDFRIAGNALWSADQMKKAGKTFSYFVYPKVDHGFYEETNPDYDAAAAKLAWSRTMQFLHAPSK